MFFICYFLYFKNFQKVFNKVLKMQIDGLYMPKVHKGDQKACFHIIGASIRTRRESRCLRHVFWAPVCHVSHVHVGWTTLGTPDHQSDHYNSAARQWVCRSASHFIPPQGNLILHFYWLVLSQLVYWHTERVTWFYCIFYSTKLHFKSL